MLKSFILRQLHLQPYQKVLEAMHLFTNERNMSSSDEIWLVQHPQVFTNGYTSNDCHLLQKSAIPVIQSDRGGKITFHGPGQQVMYVLIDLRRRKLGIRELVTLLEKTVISTLAHFSISSYTRDNAPGVYVGVKKICSLGLRIRRGCSFHGLALNVAMDLTPFLYINPCGYSGLRMTQVSDLVPDTCIDDVAPILLTKFIQLLCTSISQIRYGWD